MDKKVLKGLLNPVRMRIFQIASTKKKVTTQELLLDLPNVPQASLYRHIKKMVEDNVLEVCGENKKRGVYEKTYQIKNNPLETVNQIVDERDTDEIYNICYTFTMSILMDFGMYLKNETYDLKEDRVGFRSLPLYLTDEESDAFVKEVYQVLEKAGKNKADGERKLRKYSLAFMPVEDKE